MEKILCAKRRTLNISLRAATSHFALFIHKQLIRLHYRSLRQKKLCKKKFCFVYCTHHNKYHEIFVIAVSTNFHKSVCLILRQL